MKATHLFALSTLAGALQGACAAEDAAPLKAVTVTSTREATPLVESANSVGVIEQATIAFTAPAHPQQLLGQVPGVAVNVTNGEGHTMGIRQKIGTDPVYLYLEDGIPTRATGFFNHNALYELNLPQAGGVEVVKGIGSALYGSDAIGGTINVLSATPTRASGASLNAEAGSFGWGRLLGTVNSGQQAFGALRADINLTHTDGWRDATAYDRQSLNLRWDTTAGDSTAIKTIFGFTRIDQQTGANSALTPYEYENTPKVNARPVAYRKVDALRLSSNFDTYLDSNTLFSVTPYFRHNFMDLNGSYNFTNDPRIERTNVNSLGVLLKWRRDFEGVMKPRLIAGYDVDYSPGTRQENALDFTGCTVAGTATTSQKFNCYRVGAVIYDYDVTYVSSSPYLQGEISPWSALRLTAAVRYDQMRYMATNHLAEGDLVVAGKHYYQWGNTAQGFSRLSPKFSMNLALTPDTHLYGSYHQGFRAPSESNLFRAGQDSTLAAARIKATDALNLKPILAEQFELGLRGSAAGWDYDLTAYQLKKKNDILSQRDATNTATISSNNGATRHEGVELGLGRAFTAQWRADLAYSYARHTYAQWVTNSANYTGKDIESAPRHLGNARLTWTPSAATTAQLEWVKIGSYWLDAANTGRYSGHQLWNLRASQQIDKTLGLFARLMNVTDKRYADSAAGTGAAPTLSPGLPRTLFVGVQSQW